MRSRYSAYALGVIDHIMGTHHPKAAGDVDRKSTEKWSQEASWQGLDIVSTEAGGEADETGQVEFIARYELQGTPLTHHELAQFRRHDGRWYYWDGAMVRAAPGRARPAQGRAQRPLPVRQRAEVQEVPRRQRVAAQSGR